MIQRLEAKTTAMADTLQQLDEKYVVSEKDCKTAYKKLESLQSEVRLRDEKLAELEGDVKIEREWRERLLETNKASRKI